MRYRTVRWISPLFGLSFLAVVGLVLSVQPGQALAKGRRHHGWGKAAAAKKADAKPEAAAPIEAAAPAAPSCGGAWKLAVERQKAGKLTEARELFNSCRAAACLPAVRKECGKQFDQLEEDIPSVVAVVTDGSGEPRTDVEIKIDGHVLASQLDGRSVPVDPGVHEFTFANDTGVFSTQKVMVAEGQHHRLISASIPGAGTSASPPAAKRMPAAASPKKGVPALTPAAATVATKEADPPATASDGDKKDKDDDADQADDTEGSDQKTEVAAPRTPVMTWVLAGTGLAGIGGYALLTYWGRKDNSMLSNCSPMCEQSSTDHVHKLYLGADVSLGVGLASLVGSYLVYKLTRHPAETTEETAEKQALRFDVQPTRVGSGAVAAVSGTF